MKPPLNHIIINPDALAAEFSAIIGYRTSHTGLVTSGIDSFAFTPQTDVDGGATITSDPVTVSGLSVASADISVVGGTYSINGGSYTAAAGTVVNTDVVRARHTSSSSGLTAVNTVVTIGGVSETFTSTTAAAPAVTDATPDYVLLGETLDVVVTGTGFVTGCEATTSGTGITVNSTTFDSSTRLTVNITVSASAAQTARTITITNPNAIGGSLSSAITLRIGPFLPYGSADASVIYQHDLKSTPTAMGITATARGSGGAPEHDATNGMRGTDGSGNDACYTLAFSGAQQTAMQTAGQMSFQLQRAYVGCLAAAAEDSAGDNITVGPQFPIGFYATANANFALSLRKSTGEALSIICPGGSASLSYSFMNWQEVASTGGDAGMFSTVGLPEWVTVNIGWYTDSGTKYAILAIDGQVVARGIRSTETGLFDNLTVGAQSNWFSTSFLGINANTAMTGHWIRNLQVSTAAPTVPTLATGALDRVAVISDSIFQSPDGADSLTVAPTTPIPWYANAIGRQNTNYARIFRAVERKGYRLGRLAVGQNGGYCLVPGHSNVSVFDDTEAALRAVRAIDPTTWIIHLGDNDSAATLSEWQTYSRLLLQFVFGVGAYAGDGPTTQPTRVLWCNITHREVWDTQPELDLAASFRTDLSVTTMGWFNATYPSLAGRFGVIDTFNALRGTTAYTGKFTAGDPANQGVHWGSQGHIDGGDAVGAAIAALAGVP